MEGTRMTFGRSWFTGQPVAECPGCAAVCVYWDADDLDEDGHLLCQCETATA